MEYGDFEVYCDMFDLWNVIYIFSIIFFFVLQHLVEAALL
jgi:hypothetical protein